MTNKACAMFSARNDDPMMCICGVGLDKHIIPYAEGIEEHPIPEGVEPTSNEPILDSYNTSIEDAIYKKLACSSPHTIKFIRQSLTLIKEFDSKELANDEYKRSMERLQREGYPLVEVKDEK